MLVPRARRADAPHAVQRSAACRPACRALLGATLAALLTTGCDGGTTVEGALAPSGLSSTAGVGGGSAAVVGRTGAELVGSWTRIGGGASGVLTEVTFTFLPGGTGVRTTVARTALGAAIAIEQASFEWQGGAGTVLLRFARGLGTASGTPGAPDALLRASYSITVGLTGTTLRLDGQEYARTGS